MSNAYVPLARMVIVLFAPVGGPLTKTGSWLSVTGSWFIHRLIDTVVTSDQFILVLYHLGYLVALASNCRGVFPTTSVEFCAPGMGLFSLRNKC